MGGSFDMLTFDSACSKTVISEVVVLSRIDSRSNIVASIMKRRLADGSSIRLKRFELQCDKYRRDTSD